MDTTVRASTDLLIVALGSRSAQEWYAQFSCRTCVLHFNLARHPRPTRPPASPYHPNPNINRWGVRGWQGQSRGCVFWWSFSPKRRAVERPALTSETRALHKFLCRPLLHIGQVVALASLISPIADHKSQATVQRTKRRDMIGPDDKSHACVVLKLIVLIARSTHSYVRGSVVLFVPGAYYEHQVLVLSQCTYLQENKKKECRKGEACGGRGIRRDTGESKSRRSRTG